MKGTGNRKEWKRFKNQEKDDQERIDNFVLQLDCITTTRAFQLQISFAINLPTGCTEDVRA